MDPICAPATPLFPAALSVIRVSGTGLAESLKPLLALPEPRHATLRRLRWTSAHACYDERALVLFFPGPASTTGEDVAEFHLHGNPLLARRFLEHLGTLGVRLAEPGEFTRRALLNGKMDLLQAEALRDMVAATSDAQIQQAQARAGGQPAWLLETRKRLGPWIAVAEAMVDYGEEEGISLDQGALTQDLAELAALFHVERERSEAARWLRDGIRIVIAGRPNAGKSTLFNALAQEERAIVTEIPGTTRDVLDVRAEWAGLPLILFDTAGLRESDDPVERLGVARVAEYLEKADLILHLVPVMDAAPDSEVMAHLAPYRGKTLEVRTFADQLQQSEDCPGALLVSARAGRLDPLAQALSARFLGGRSSEECLGALATPRQRGLLLELIHQVELLQGLASDAPPELRASLLQGAWGLLARLTGEDRAESALDEVFSGFCLGK